MASTSASLTAQAVNSGDLVDLVSSSASITIYPNDDAVLATLHSRFRADLPYTRLGSSHIVVVNPYKTLANVNDASAKDYEDRYYKDTSLPLADSPKPLQPHIYEMAARMYLMLKRRNESQSVCTRCVTRATANSESLKRPAQGYHWLRQIVKHQITCQTATEIVCTHKKRDEAR